MYDAGSQTLIVYQLGAWIGTYSGSPKVRIGMGGVSGSTPDPGTRLGYTAEFTPSTAYTDILGGASYVQNVTPFLAAPGRYSLAITCRDGVISHSMRAAASISAANRNFYDKSGLASTVPTSPIGGDPAYNGHMSVWAVGMVNEAPSTPINRTPYGTITDGDTTPDLAADFNDANTTLPNGQSWDYVNQVQIQVRQVGSTSLKWDTTYTASSSERTNKRTSRTYAGSALSFGVAYEWRIRQSDRAGAWSSWSSWLQFTLAGAGAVGTPTTPSGRITTRTPASFVAPWTSQGSLATNAVQIRLLVGGQVIATSGTISKTVAAGSNITISWAESGFSTLDWGTPYTFQIRGRDTANVWSDWSTARAFNTNGAPTVPAFRQPADATVTTSRPKLRAKATDPDGNTVTIYFRIKNSSGTVLYTRTGTYSASSGYWEYQTTATDLASYATYRWDCYSYDGSLYSGEATTAAAASKSSELTFIYATGPTATITSPTEGQVFSTRVIPMAWTAPDQVKRQIFFYDESGKQVYASNDVTTSETAVNVLNAAISNGQTYTAVVKVTDANGLTGNSDPVAFSLSYDSATMIQGVTAYPVTLGFDVLPTAVYISWEGTTYPASQFNSYDVYRVPLDSPGGTAVGDRVLLRRITNPLQTAFVDAFPASNEAYAYQVEQSITVGIDVLTSDPAEAQAVVAFNGIVLGSVWEPETYHVELRYAADVDDEGTWEYAQDITYVLPTGAQQSTAIRGSRMEWNPSGTYKLFGDEFATREQRIAALKDLIRRGGTMCIRDGHGERRYVSLVSARIKRHRLWDEAELKFQEVAFSPADTAEVA